MLELYTNSWIEMLVMVTAGCFAFIGLVAVKKYQSNHVSDQSLISSSDQPNSDPPRLVPTINDLSSACGNQMMLMLKLENVGSPLYYQGISIQYQHSMHIKLHDDIRSNYIEKNKTMHFVLTTKANETCVFHFNVIFTDINGRTYSQEIKGGNATRPIAEAALELVV